MPNGALLRDLSGMTFGMLTVIERGPDRVEPSGRRKVQYWCRCSCPAKTVILTRGDYITEGKKLSCGCTSNSSVRKMYNLQGPHKYPSELKPRLRRLPKNKSLDNIRYLISLPRVSSTLTDDEKKEQTCLSQYIQSIYIHMIDTSIGYIEGGTNQICNEWNDSTISDDIIRQNRGFVNFYNWSIVNDADRSKSMVRIDNMKPYSPENCRWVETTQYNPIPVAIPNTVKTVRFNGTRAPVDQVANALGYLVDPFSVLVKSNFYEPIEVTMKNNVPYIYGNRCNYKINAIYFEDENGTLIDQSSYKEPDQTTNTEKPIPALWAVDSYGFIIHPYYTK